MTVTQSIDFQIENLRVQIKTVSDQLNFCEPVRDSARANDCISQMEYFEGRMLTLQAWLESLLEQLQLLKNLRDQII